MSYSQLRADGVAMFPAAEADGVERATFIRKVYGLMFTGIVAFALAACLPVYGIIAEVPVLGAFGMALVKMPWWLSLILMIGISYAAHSVSMIRGLNLVGFYGMAVFMGCITVNLILYALAVAGLKGGATIIFQAFGLTCIVFGGLSAYALISRKDFSFLGGFLAIGTFVMLGAIIIAGIMSMMGYNMDIMHFGISIALTLLMSIYVLYDTSNMLHRFSTDMVVPAALALMVDFIIMFRQILYMLLRSRD